jgi:hypothetical protein
MQVSPCCVGKLKFSMGGGTSFSSEYKTWRTLPRMSGAEQEVRSAGEQLLSAAASRAPDREEQLTEKAGACLEAPSVNSDGSTGK